MKILQLVLLLLFAPFPSYCVEKIEDLSHLPLFNPDFAKREVAKLRLDNGLELLLISDPEVDESGAALAVKAGSWDDPKEYPGMAHFCEHLLFLGTETYPDETEFSSLLANYAGTTNAWTSPCQTVYLFSSQEAGFLPLLEQFAHFFIDPLFNPACIAREMHAVDQEYAKSLENDFWRVIMVGKETSNSDHPHREFSIGNSKTLSQIPQTAVKEWHQQHYGADRMRVVLFSSLPLETLKEKGIELFSLVPEAKAPLADFSKPITSEEQKGHILYIKPIQNRQLFILNWELPPEFSDEPTHSAKLIAYALRRGQKYSLFEELRKEQLIDSASVDVEEGLGEKHAFLQFCFELSEKGMEKVELVALRTFQALASLRTSGIPAYLFREMNRIAELEYQYQSRTDTFTTLGEIGEAIWGEPLATYPRSQLFASEHNPETLASLLSLLTPETCSFTLLASPEKTKVAPDRTEKWFQVEYATRPIPKTWLASWARAKPHPDIRLAEPNPFLPTALELVPPSSPLPSLLAAGEFGTAYYARCSEYLVPEIDLHLHLLSPLFDATPRSQVLTSLYLDHVTDLLHPTLSAAGSANLKASFSLERRRLHIHLSGFSEKAPLLLQEILTQMPADPPTREQFALYVDRHQKEYENEQKALPLLQGKELLSSLLIQGKTTSREKLTALSSIHYEEFLAFHTELFNAVHFEALFAGNWTFKEAESAWLDIVHTLSRTPYPSKEHPEIKVLHLPDKGGPFAISQAVHAQGNAALLAIEEGPMTFENRAAQQILSNALEEAFFNELRTRQKTGYIASASSQEIEGQLFQFFLVQSSSHQPEDLLYRFELFLEEYLQNFSENISLERFEVMKESAIAELENRFRNLQSKGMLWDLLAFEKGGDFSFIEKRIAGLEALQYDAFVSRAREFLSRTNRKRLALLIEGKLPSPFAFEPTTPIQLKELATYSICSPEKAIAASETSPSQN